MKNITSIDLNLLVVFRTLMQEKNTVRAGKILGMGQPTISHALRRLRESFNDPLFVRASRGLVPTRRALELAPGVSEFLQNIEQLLLTPGIFDPKSAAVTFRLATTDYFEHVALPQLLKIMEREAPHCTLISRPTSGELPKSALESGEIDLAIAGFYGKLPDNHYSQHLFSDDFVCVARRAHPHIGQKLKLKQYASEKHILISPQGDMKSQTAQQLKRHGFEQQFLAGVSSFATPGAIVCESNLLVTCPRRLALSYQRFLPVAIHELPFSIKGIAIVQVWHGRHHADPAHTWLRRLIHQVAQTLT